MKRCKNRSAGYGLGMIIGLASFLSAEAQSVNSIGMEMVSIEPGTFLMGDTGLGRNYDEAPAHPVTISRQFRISATEVTNAQFEQFMPEHRVWRGKNGFSSRDNEAVIYVNYQEAVAFCKWLSEREGKIYRLPTEAEWEYVCRAGSTGPYAIGDRALPKSMLKRQEHAWNPKSVPLEGKRGEPNAWGVYDMHGNVEEWCLDYYAPYPESAQTDPAGPDTGECRVVRGGSHNTPVTYLRSANRSGLLPEDRTLYTGFRVVEVLDDDSLRYASVQARKPSGPTEGFRWKKRRGALFVHPRNFIRNEDIPTTKGMFQHNHCPAATWLPNGDLLAIWFSTEDEKDREMTILASRLKNGCREWSKPELFFKVPDRNMTGSALYYDESSGILYHFNGVEAAGTWQNLACIVRTSSDNGYSWTKPRFVNAEHEPGNQVIAGTIRTRKGTLLQPCDATPTVRGGSILHISEDEGKTWVRSDNGLQDSIPDFAIGKQGHRIAGIHAGVVELLDGRLLAFGRDNNLLHNGEYRMPQSISRDSGRSWHYDASEFPPISSGQRLVLTRLREGPLLLVSFTDARIDSKNIRGMEFTRNGKTFIGYGMYAALSFDEGRTWPIKKLLTDGTEDYLYGGAFTGYFKMDACHAEPKGYLAVTQSPDGVIHLFSSALHYQFNLEWLTSEDNQQTNNHE